MTTTENITSATIDPGFLFNNADPLGNSGSALADADVVGSQGLSNFAVGRMNSELGFGGLVLSASSEAVSILIRALQEKRRVEGFTYIWDQAVYNPITGEALNHIHYRFPDGSEIKKAFTYDWRLWTLPEIQELLLEAGFREVNVYWEGTDEDTGQGNDEFKPTRRGEACQGWIAYLAADK